MAYNIGQANRIVTDLAELKRVSTVHRKHGDYYGSAVNRAAPFEGEIAVVRDPSYQCPVDNGGEAGDCIGEGWDEECNPRGIGVYVWMPNVHLEDVWTELKTLIAQDLADAGSRTTTYNQNFEDASPIGKFVVRPNDRMGGVRETDNTGLLGPDGSPIPPSEGDSDPYGGEPGRWVSVIPHAFWKNLLGPEHIRTHIASQQDCKASCGPISIDSWFGGQDPLAMGAAEQPILSIGDDGQAVPTILSPTPLRADGHGWNRGTWTPMLGNPGDKVEIRLNTLLSAWNVVNEGGPDGENTSQGDGFTLRVYCGIDPHTRYMEGGGNGDPSAGLANMKDEAELLCEIEVDMGELPAGPVGTGPYWSDYSGHEFTANIELNPLLMDEKDYYAQGDGKNGGQEDVWAQGGAAEKMMKAMAMQDGGDDPTADAIQKMPSMQDCKDEILGVLASTQSCFYSFSKILKSDDTEFDYNNIWVGARGPALGDIMCGRHADDNPWAGQNNTMVVFGDNGQGAPYDQYMLPGEVPQFIIYDAETYHCADAEVVWSPDGGEHWVPCTDMTGMGWEAFQFQNSCGDNDGVALRVISGEDIPGCMDTAACNYDDTATIDDGSCDYWWDHEGWCDCDGNVYDCVGICGGSTVVDCLGECGGDAVMDCAGICGGSAVEDCFGICGGDAVMDCAGICGGNAVMDCAGICNGTSFLCPDGKCVENESLCEGGGILGCMDPKACNYDDAATEDDGSCEYMVDCFGICGGDAVMDDCGVCEGDNSSCTDCWGVVNGPAIEDNCGTCREFGMDDPSWNADMDCAGECFGDAVVDECGVCDGPGQTECADGSFVCPPDECPPDGINGCTDLYACNYNPDADVDDGSCEYGVDVEVIVIAPATGEGISWALKNSYGNDIWGGALLPGDTAAQYVLSLCCDDYTLEMHSNDGNGWNGAGYTFTVMDTNEVLAEGTLEGGTYGEAIIPGPCSEPGGYGSGWSAKATTISGSRLLSGVNNLGWSRIGPPTGDGQSIMSPNWHCFGNSIHLNNWFMSSGQNNTTCERALFVTVQWGCNQFNPAELPSSGHRISLTEFDMKVHPTTCDVELLPVTSDNCYPGGGTEETIYHDIKLTNLGSDSDIFSVEFKLRSLEGSDISIIGYDPTVGLPSMGWQYEFLGPDDTGNPGFRFLPSMDLGGEPLPGNSLSELVILRVHAVLSPGGPDDNVCGSNNIPPDDGTWASPLLLDAGYEPIPATFVEEGDCRHIIVTSEGQSANTPPFATITINPEGIEAGVVMADSEGQDLGGEFNVHQNDSPQYISISAVDLGGEGDCGTLPVVYHGEGSQTGTKEGGEGTSDEGQTIQSYDWTVTVFGKEVPEGDGYGISEDTPNLLTVFGGMPEHFMYDIQLQVTDDSGETNSVSEPAQVSVYVMPCDPPPPAGGCLPPDPQDCPVGYNTVRIVTFPATYPDETSWELLDDKGTQVAKGCARSAVCAEPGPGWGDDCIDTPEEDGMDPGAPHDVTVCIPDGCYTFRKYDGYGDGWGSDDTVYCITWFNETTGNSGSTEGLFFYDPEHHPCEPVDDIININMPMNEDGTNPCGEGDEPLLPPGEDIPGCMDSNACNYNDLATIDDKSCTFEDDCGDCWPGGDKNPDWNSSMDCHGDCHGTAHVDCAQICVGGNTGLVATVVDECGICGGPGETECSDGTFVCPPEECPPDGEQIPDDGWVDVNGPPDPDAKTDDQDPA